MGKNVPKLRFKGFEGEWEEKRLGDICTVITGNTPSTKESLNYGNEYLWASPGDLGNFKYIVNTKQKLSKLGFSKVRKIAKGSVLVTCIGSTIGKIGIASIDMSSNQQINSINCFDGAINEYIYYFLEYNFKKYMLYISFQAVPIINKSQFENFHIQIPDIKEQNKIVNFLSKVDRYIELQEKKVSELEKYKKGMMQKIFSQKIRFRKDDGGEYPEWEEKCIDEFVKKITEKNKDFRVKTVISNSAKNGLISQRNFFDKDIANQENVNGYYVIKKDDFVYNPRKSNEAPYGPINKLEYDEGIVSPLYFCFRSKGSINVNYLKYYFKSTKWHRYIYMNSDQGARHDRVSIKDSEFMKMKIIVPSVEEQEKISNFFLKLDLLIEKQSKRLDELRMWKKGLLQKMFV